MEIEPIDSPLNLTRSNRDGIFMGLLVVLIVTQIPTSVKDHKINVCRDTIETYNQSLYKKYKDRKYSKRDYREVYQCRDVLGLESDKVLIYRTREG